MFEGISLKVTAMSHFTGHKKNGAWQRFHMGLFNGFKMNEIYEAERKVATHLFTVAVTAPSDQI